MEHNAVDQHDYIYIYLDIGTVQVKRDDEGIAADIFRLDGETCVATTYAHRNELLSEKEL